MRLRYLIFVGVAAGATFAQTPNPPVQRDGAFWSRSGSIQPFELPAQIKRIELVTRGSSVVVRGGATNQVQIKVEQRVRAASAEEAARYWGPFGQSLSPYEIRGDRMRLAIQPPGAERVMTEIEITVPRGLSLARVENRGGGVEIADIDGNVQIMTNGGPLRADRIRGNLVANTGWGAIRLGAIGGTVLCSSGGGEITLERAGKEADCHTAGGNITVKNAGGSLTLTTEGGNISVEKAAESVRARSLAGLIEVSEAGGTVFADSGGGGIHVGASKGLQAESASGMVRVQGTSGPLSVATVMGNILAELMAGAVLQNSMLAAQSGDITVMIPAGVGVSVRARNDFGITPRIVSDFPEMQVKSIGFRSPTIGQGAIQGGGPVLDLSAASGVIYLKKVK